MTWAEAIEQARLETGYTTPVSWFNDVIALVFASKAQHLIQQATSAIKREASIDLAADLNAAGQAALPSDFKLADTVTWAPDSSSVAWKPVKLITTDMFKAMVENHRAPLSTAPRLPQNDGQIFGMIELGSITIWPSSGATGVVKMRYAPHMIPYSPSNDVEWENYGADPTEQMEEEGPDDAIRAAHWGIVEYIKAQIIALSPHGLKTRGGEYALAMQNFQQSIETLRHITVDYSASTVVPSYFGGTQ
jgi:hypothetical protein